MRHKQSFFLGGHSVTSDDIGGDIVKEILKFNLFWYTAIFHDIFIVKFFLLSINKRLK